MAVLDLALQAVMNFLGADNYSQRYQAFQESTQRYMDTGISAIEAQNQAALEMLDTNPDFAEAKKEFESIAHELPKQYRADLMGALDESRQNRSEYQTGLRGIGEGYARRENDVMGYLRGAGQQEIKDINRTFDTQQSDFLGDLGGRGLAGSGTGASYLGGFATQRGDELARSRERTGQMLASNLAGLRGDTLGYGERSAGSLYGAGRDVTNDRYTALNNAYNADVSGRTALADNLYGRGQTGLDTMQRGFDRFSDFYNNINLIPPDPTALNNSATSFGQRLGRGNR